MQNLCIRVPEEIWSEIMAIRDAAGYEQGKHMSYGFIEKYRDKFPCAMTYILEK